MMISIKTVELKDLETGKNFRYPRPTCLSGIYTKGERVVPGHADYFYVHEVGCPDDVFISGERTDVIPVDE